MVPAIPIATTETLWLMGAGLVGALAQALWTTGQKKFGWETLQDAFFGVAIGGLWTVPLFGLWPPFQLHADASYVQRALLIAVFTALGVRVLKRVLIGVVPAYMERLLAKDGAVLPAKNGDATK